MSTSTPTPPLAERATDEPGREVPGPGIRASVTGTLRVRSDPLAWVHEQRARFGDVFAARLPRWMPGAPSMLVYACEPVAVREILTDPRRFVKRSPVWDELALGLGNGLLTSEGDVWRGQRRTLQPLFTRRRIADYTDAFLTATEFVGDSWNGRPDVELVDEMERVTLGSVSRALFGTDVTDEVAPIVHATDELSALTIRRGVAPVTTPRWLPTPQNRRLATLERDLEHRVERIVDRAASHAGERDDLVSRLLDAEDPQTGGRLDEREILEQALIFLLAGYDTTSTALAFTLHELGARPDLQDAVRAEIARVVGDRRPGPEDAAAMELTRRCLLEAMRLHPPAYITGRSATVDTTVAGYRVPAGTVTLTVFGELHRNERFWPDPDRFDPDRFLPEAAADRDHYAYLPFGGGPRSCIGEHFAMLEATLALAVLLRRWRVATPGGPIPMRYGITQRADAPVRAKLQPA
ncbi:MAG: cytochrome P450 [Nitriliruptor sp.]